LTGDVRARSLHKESEKTGKRERERAQEGGERGDEKKGAREKDTKALFLSRHHHHLAIQLLTRKSEEE
jgi:hypothetical protein